MRIPTSAIVMAFAVAAPLGLAIRDSMKSDEGEPLTDYEQARAEAEAARERVYEQEKRLAAEHEQKLAESKAREAARKKRVIGVAVLRKLTGTQPASLGPVFDDVQLGKPLPASEPDAALVQIRAVDHDASIDLRMDADAKKLHAIDVTFALSKRDCETILADFWSPGEDGVWLAAATHTRAVLDGTLETCTLRFDMYEPAASWVAKLPLDAVGSPAKKLAVDPSAYISEHEIDWRGPGVGRGRHAANYTVSLVDGKVAQILIYCDTDAASFDAIRKALTARLKSQPAHSSSGDRVIDEWSGRTPVTLIESPASFSISIGKSS